MNHSLKIYIKLKREKAIYFFEVAPNDSIEGLKKKLTLFYKAEPSDIRLYLGSRVCGG